jgi:predicted permease
MMNSETGEFFQTVVTTFVASIKSVGTACTLASVGIYLHQRGFVVGNGKRTLALISQQVTIPLLFFTKILYCNQDWSPEPCPNVTDSLEDVWILLVWPLWVCTAGICVGYCVTLLAGTPSHQRNPILASVAFGNSTGLPITLLTVIHANFGPSSALGVVDPTLFLSVYLIVYPVLQWGIGGLLLAPPANSVESETEKESETETDHQELQSIEALRLGAVSLKDPFNDLSLVTKGSGISSLGDDTDGGGYETETDPELQMQRGLTTYLSFKSSIRRSIRVELDKTKKTLANNVIHNKSAMPETYQISHRGLDTTDDSLYWSVQENLNRWGKPQFGKAPSSETMETGHPKLYKSALTSSGQNIGMDISGQESPNGEIIDEQDDPQDATTEASALLGRRSVSSTSYSSSSSQLSDDREELMATISKILKRCFQPPVIAALLGILFASVPVIRGVLVDIEDRNGSAPLQWFFDGLYEAGRAAVPINMIILGCNLSASYMLHSPLAPTASSGITVATTHPRVSRDHEKKEKNSSSSSAFFGTKTALMIVFGKMIAMPLVGYVSTLALSTVYVVPHEIAGSLYLVLLIVFLCPTANNVMVMVELGGTGKGSKESMARIIAYQYAFAPLVLSGTVTGAVLMASAMSEQSYLHMDGGSS